MLVIFLEDNAVQFFILQSLEVIQYRGQTELVVSCVNVCPVAGGSHLLEGLFVKSGHDNLSGFVLHKFPVLGDWLSPQRTYSYCIDSDTGFSHLPCRFHRIVLVVLTICYHHNRTTLLALCAETFGCGEYRISHCRSLYRNGFSAD